MTMLAGAVAFFLKITFSNSMDIRVGQILGQIKFEEEYSVIRCRDPTFNIKS